jgi:hypothetical protein
MQHRILAKVGTVLGWRRSWDGSSPLLAKWVETILGFLELEQKFQFRLQPMEQPREHSSRRPIQTVLVCRRIFLHVVHTLQS